MLVTITNLSSSDFFVSMLYKQLTPSESVTVSRTFTDLNDQGFMKSVEDGTLGLSFAVEDGDSAAIGHPATLESFADAAALPAASARPLFTTVWQVDAAYAVWTDGKNWRDAAGVITT